MSPRTGRPILHEQARDKRLNLRLSEEELKLLDDLSGVLGKSRTDVIVEGLRMLKESVK